MNRDTLQTLGLTVRDAEGRIEADLDVTSISLVNPLTRKLISKVTFAGVGSDRLIVLDPPELLGIEAIRLSHVETISELEEQLLGSFNDSISHLQRRSADLQALGLSPRVDPETLRLTAEVDAGNVTFIIAADKRGNFRVLQATRDGEPVELPEMQAFELSEFREVSALVGYLTALIGESAPEPTMVRQKPSAPQPEPLVALGEVVERFGADALLPPKSALEFLVELKVEGNTYRFAAARVMGRTFRGLLAGSAGKLWADRFELEEFPGVVPLVAKLLNVSTDAIDILGPSRGA